MMLTQKEQQLMKHFKVEELEERLEMKKWGHGKKCGPSGTKCINPVDHK